MKILRPKEIQSLARSQQARQRTLPRNHKSLGPWGRRAGPARCPPAQPQTGPISEIRPFLSPDSRVAWLAGEVAASRSPVPRGHSGAIYISGQGLHPLTATPEPSAPSPGRRATCPAPPSPASVPPDWAEGAVPSGPQGPHPPLHQGSRFLTSATALGLCRESAGSGPASLSLDTRTQGAHAFSQGERAVISPCAGKEVGPQRYRPGATQWVTQAQPPGLSLCRAESCRPTPSPQSPGSR